MDANGTIHKYSKTDNLNDEFYGSVVSLGCLGIVISLKIQCEPAFKLEQIEWPGKLEDVCEKF
jgi:L-gulonolactone oxidase